MSKSKLQKQIEEMITAWNAAKPADFPPWKDCKECYWRDHEVWVECPCCNTFFCRECGKVYKEPDKRESELKWEPWMGETAKELYEKGKPENFLINVGRSIKLRKNDVVYREDRLNTEEGSKLYKIIEIKEVDNTNPLFLKVSGRWRKLSVMESIDHYDKDKKIVFY